ncbi:farnesylated protein PEX19 [Nannizzia gypsea CBS 118893]|uniref:Farnesylated protein PEX19 n=1 Tax=Arthroderma gypseum (strain ATCC MYA-4604 / CBS 118893) TaxID=535722 RepID=E4UNM8_ARTGP|nr:farnesylated protein PEX19 [Nannizzia gypsea CBS 118893]EFQ99631.1 farnesylated protein PEX19 [Nannizzia gypsea CBS 118893]
MADTNTPAPAEKEAKLVAEAQPSKPEEVTKKPPTQGEEEESDWEELDDVLDDFSAAKNTSQPTQDKTIPESQGKQADLNPELSTADQDALLKQLEAGMAELMGNLPTDASGQTKDGDSSKEKISDIPGMPQFPGNEDWNALTEELEKKGFTMADVMKLMMGEELMTGGEGIPGIDGSTDTGKPSSTEKQPSPPSTKKGEDNFQDTIQKTMERMQESGDKATAEVNESGNDDMLMQILKAMESSGFAGAGEGDDGNLDKLFMGIMEQLSNKEMLYEPLKELDDKFGPWLKENKDKAGKEDLERYELQASLVSDIVKKFEEKNFSDDKPEDRAYIWDKMQKMQSAGSPPDDLISGPFMDESKLQALGQDGCAQQ